MKRQFGDETSQFTMKIVPLGDSAITDFDMEVLTGVERQGLEERFAAGVTAHLVIGLKALKQVVVMAVPAIDNRLSARQREAMIRDRLVKIGCDAYMAIQAVRNH